MNMTERFELLPPSTLIPSPTNARVHTERQLRYLRGSLREFGFVSPVVVDADNNIIAGHAMVEVAIAEGLPQVPCVRAEHLTDTQRRIQDRTQPPCGTVELGHGAAAGQLAGLVRRRL